MNEPNIHKHCDATITKLGEEVAHLRATHAETLEAMSRMRTHMERIITDQTITINTLRGDAARKDQAMLSACDDLYKLRVMIRAMAEPIRKDGNK